MTDDTETLQRLTAPTYFFDYEHERVQAFVRQALNGATSPTEQAVRLYYAVRDDVNYEVYRQDLSPADCDPVL